MPVAHSGKCDDDLRVHLPSEYKAVLRTLAEQEGRTLSAYARRVLLLHATVEVTKRSVEGPNRAR